MVDFFFRASNLTHRECRRRFPACPRARACWDATAHRACIATDGLV